MEMYDNEYKTKIDPRIKLNHKRYTDTPLVCEYSHKPTPLSRVQITNKNVKNININVVYSGY